MREKRSRGRGISEKPNGQGSIRFVSTFVAVSAGGVVVLCTTSYLPGALEVRGLFTVLSLRCMAYPRDADLW